MGRYNLYRNNPDSKPVDFDGDKKSSLHLRTNDDENYCRCDLVSRPDMVGDDFVEFDSMINIRPAQGNRSRGVDDLEIRRKIVAIVDRVVVR